MVKDPGSERCPTYPFKILVLREYVRRRLDQRLAQIRLSGNHEPQSALSTRRCRNRLS
jgi:hypothetical protein